MDNTIQAIGRRARAAAVEMGIVETGKKDHALTLAAHAIVKNSAEILAANARDVQRATEKGVKASFIERLTLTDARIRKMAEGLADVAKLKDPVREIRKEWVRPNGLRIRKRRVPLGVIAIIYESRPNVTIDAAALCLKSGNCVILRGGSDAIESNTVLADILRGAAEEAGLPIDCVQLVKDTSRQSAEALMTANDFVDVLIPRGGKSLIQSVVKNATVPVIQTGDGVCHVYVDSPCDMDMAVDIAVSARTSRPSVCNSAETLLVDRAIADEFLPRVLDALKQAHVEVRGCPEVLKVCDWAVAASEFDWDEEYNDLIYAIKVVDGVDAAIDHINKHGTRHSEAIVTSDPEHGRRFQDRVDAAAVYVNASTRFTDGGEFGFGAEIGISNQKLHARGPMGLTELTTYKYEIDGRGQVR